MYACSLCLSDALDEFGSRPVLSPCLSFLMPNMSSTLSSRLPVVTVLRS